MSDPSDDRPVRRPSRWRIFLMGALSLAHDMEGQSVRAPTAIAVDALPGWYRLLPSDALSFYKDVPLLRAELARQALNGTMLLLYFLLAAGVWLILIHAVTGDLPHLASKTALWWTSGNRTLARPLAGVLGALFPIVYLCAGLLASGVTVRYLQRWRSVPFSRPLVAPF